MILDQQDIDVFIGLDVGKSGHHAVALDRAGVRLFDKALPNDEARLRDILAGLAKHGRLLLVVDQPATIGALPVAVARDAGALVGYLPGLAMRRIADLHPGEAKTDARDAAIIAEAARSMPHTLRTIALDDETLAELGVLCGFDDDLAAQITATSNRIRGPLTHIHPALERALGPHLDHPAVADLLTRYPTPAALKTAGRGHVRARLKKHAPRAAERLTDAIFTALNQQTVVVVGTNAAGTVLPNLAEQLLSLRRQRDAIGTQVQALVEAHPLHKVLTSMPGVGVRTCARILTEVTGKHFANAAHLASYAGIAPVTRRSGTSIRGEHTSRCGNKKLKRALFLSAFAALHHPPHGPTTTANAPKANATTRPSSPSPADDPTSSSPCSETEPSTKTPNPQPFPQQLDENHRGTPPRGLPPVIPGRRGSRASRRDLGRSGPIVLGGPGDTAALKTGLLPGGGLRTRQEAGVKAPRTVFILRVPCPRVVAAGDGKDVTVVAGHREAKP